MEDQEENITGIILVSHPDLEKAGHVFNVAKFGNDIKILDGQPEIIQAWGPYFQNLIARDVLVRGDSFIYFYDTTNL